MPVYSFSQINTYTTCPRKYRFKYVDKIKEQDQEQSPDLFLGKAVHEVLEMLYKRINELQKPTVEECLAWFDQIRTEWDDDAIILKEGQTKDSYYRRGTLYISEYRNKHAPFEDIRVVATEGMMTFSLDQEGSLKFRGVIDRLDKQGNTLIINDYKTNKSLPPQDKHHYQEQLTLYGLGVRQQYGKYAEHITAKLHYLHFDTVDEWEISDETMQPVVEKYTGLVKEIEEKRFHHNMGDTTVFPAVENPSCRRCSYQSICPLWAHMSMEDEVVLGERTVRTLVDQYASVSKQISALEKEKKGLKDALQTYVKQTGLQQLFGEEHAIKVATMTNYRIENQAQLLQSVQKQGYADELLQVDRFALARLIKSGDLAVAELAGVEKNESIVLRVTKNKHGK